MLVLRNICLIVAALLAAGSISFAEENVSDSGSSAPAAPDRIQVKMLVFWNDIDMDISTDGLRNDVQYMPNDATILGVGLSYNGLGLKLTHASGSGDRDQRVYGTTEVRDYRMYYYSAALCVDLMYQRYKGYYLDDPDDFGYAAGDPPTIRGDLDMRNVAFNLYYVVSERLSLPAAFEQTDIQRECGGSFILMMTLQQNDISSDGSLFPPSVASQVGMEYRGGRYQHALAGAGYGYGFVLRHFFFTPMLMACLGMTRARDDRGADSPVHYDMSYKLIMKFALGYNGDTFYWGVINMMDGLGYNAKRTDAGSPDDERTIDVNVFAHYVELFFGMKFDI
ncbi:MAG: DUF4421 family protein [Spirochaetes bacterium]|nr:DUF4421 family protein [Spirochaetota bacterium]